MHEPAAVHMAQFGPERSNPAPFGVEPFIERPGALLERVALPYVPALKLTPGDADEPVLGRYRLILAHGVILGAAASSAATPGRVLPSIHSRNAPPAVKTCRTLVWNGPLGAFETPPFDTATVALARTAAALTREGSLVSVAGSGDTVAALNHAGVADQFSYVSTAGGAFLEWMEGKTLPGVAALEAAAPRMTR